MSIRAFISVDIPDKIKKYIIKIQNSLPEFTGKKTEQENLHLTLKFLGEIDEKMLKKVKDRLNKIKFNKFESILGETGFFDNQKYGVIWIFLSNCNELQKQIDNVLEGSF